MKKHLKGLALILMMIGISSIGYAQTIYRIQDNKNVSMKLNGTSTFHDWEMDATRAKGEAQLIFSTTNESELASIKALSFTLEVKDLKSDNSKLDKNAYKALKADKYKYISYKLTSSEESPEKGGFLLKTRGKLTIAGTTKDIAMDIHLIINQNTAITYKGSYELNMTDYNVEPPSFMLGAMSTGDALKLDFEVKYIKQNKG
ncbi:YceI family protein [Aequorivita sp. CIP111184]|uniref:YceI family protein n=1 Tax=Aequorivita sp. CIP111184 TaxID=2211356 RepID=UPI000DBC231C|nr:YceI family protein [Aequorivita sp. CIP111184]SRX55458.1 hypothetical protein AEQU1_02480 [Aequorivita sp. CIP111184]